MLDMNESKKHSLKLQLFCTTSRLLSTELGSRQGNWVKGV